ncbi:glycosyltransferase family 2 protein [Nocardioides sp. SYSU DS0651]|uniref:glycosyltransferase family 2 protein n=1 Tax=Nocardioides sp. SYSU DS0651 TaxID=3415955 RepID=UPI003F4B0FF9
MIATVSTVKDTLANVQRFVRGNLAGGVDHMVVFLDAPDPEVEAWLGGQEHVTHVMADDAWWGGRRPAELNNRQRMHANIAKALFTVVPGVDWIFHVDADEICQIDREAIAAVPRGRDAVRLKPLEAVSRKHWDHSPTWFKQLLDEQELVLLEVLGVIEKPSNGHLFHGHVEGKAGVRPSLDRWLTIHRIVDEKREPVAHHEADGLSVLHYESYSGEDFVRKWSSILSAGPDVSLRPVRQRTAQAVRALIGKPLTEELRERYLMRIFEATTEDRFDTLRELGLLVEAHPDQGTHRPRALAPDARDRLEELLGGLAGQPKGAFKVCGPAAEVQDVLSRLGAGGRSRLPWRQNRRP